MALFWLCMFYDFASLFHVVLYFSTVLDLFKTYMSNTVG